jgi:hypothetical protein
MNDNPDDGCKLCTADRRVFASSIKYQGFALDGLYGADQRCRMLAAIAMLPNFLTYRAWLSDSNTAAADRLVHSKGRYILGLFRQICGSDSCLLDQILGSRREGLAFAA